jgi:hypothetical protein
MTAPSSIHLTSFRIKCKIEIKKKQAVEKLTTCLRVWLLVSIGDFSSVVEAFFHLSELNENMNNGTLTAGRR